MANKVDPPEWLTLAKEEGRRVYIVSGDQKRPIATGASVDRFTATQVILTVKHQGAERRFRLSDLREVGPRADYQSSPELAPLSDHRVQRAIAQAKVARVMMPLREAVEASLPGARLYQRDLDMALGVARRIRDAATQAVKELEEI
jgi:hypothetical protein